MCIGPGLEVEMVDLERKQKLQWHWKNVNFCLIIFLDAVGGTAVDAASPNSGLQWITLDLRFSSVLLCKTIKN